jgi:hypothetical protein
VDRRLLLSSFPVNTKIRFSSLFLLFSAISFKINRKSAREIRRIKTSADFFFANVLKNSADFFFHKNRIHGTENLQGKFSETKKTDADFFSANVLKNSADFFFTKTKIRKTENLQGKSAKQKKQTPIFFSQTS